MLFWFYAAAVVGGSTGTGGSMCFAPILVGFCCAMRSGVVSVGCADVSVMVWKYAIRAIRLKTYTRIHKFMLFSLRYDTADN